VCAEFRQPVGIITKGALVERDVDLLAGLAQYGAATVFVSVPFADAADSRAIEPFVALPERRLRAMRTLADAGVPVGVSVSPLIPGLNDHQVPAILEAARDAGATQAFHVMLRLPAEVHDIFRERLEAAFPLRVDKVMSLVHAMRGGRNNDPRFGSRMRGEGARYQLMVDLFEKTAKRLGMTAPVPAVSPSPFRRPNQQQSLFGENP
jgi:DNA repair photolyase